MNSNNPSVKGFLQELRRRVDLSRYKRGVYELFRAENIHEPVRDTTAISDLTFGDLKNVIQTASTPRKPEQVNTASSRELKEEPELKNQPQDIPLRQAAINYTGLEDDTHEFIIKKADDTRGAITAKGTMTFRGHKIVWDRERTAVEVDGKQYPATVGLMILLLYNGAIREAISEHWGKITESDLQNFFEISRKRAIKLADPGKIPKDATLVHIYNALTEAQRKQFAAYYYEAIEGRGANRRTRVKYFNPAGEEVVAAASIGQALAPSAKKPKKDSAYEMARFKLLQAAVAAGNDSPLIRAEIEDLRKRLA